ncbi:MAG: DUF2312 domain-containing protein [Alphaproteobacteria bacterium]|nr:DUF2312 domain-containing protein [Alphaproteobacteria bacterium]MBQ2811423.1 DUF2312 domain-containing protein [Alphaproteobacteria bacterium]MBQ8870815.1 DUF2312 domain-containing protein [Alphaproteobacteria bacterium]
MTEVGGIATDRLRSLIERIEKLEEDKREVSTDIREVYAEAKSAGFDVKTMKAIIKLRKMEQADREEEDFLLETYKKALDM